ncbi:dipeptidase [Dokdonella sp.]|uniref:dipeptidase n=1 Tax=Dokdonella sp. TaxID=2291710 RepID=UPI002F4154C4
MPDRRGFLVAAGVAAAGMLGPRLRAAGAPAWPRYRDTIAIDGESGLFLFAPDADPRDAPRELAAARASGLGAVLLSVGPNGRYWNNDAQFERMTAQLAHVRAVVAKHAHAFRLVGETADLRRAHEAHQLGLIPRFQGSEPIGEDLDRVALFRRLGIRVVQITHNRRNLAGDGCTEPGNAGLSRLGHALIERLNTDKVVVDLAHGSQRTIAEGIAASKAPVLISHTGCRALADLPRNTTDAELRAMAERGGVAGIIFWPYLRTDTQPMAIDVVRHIEHAIDVCGEDHVGIGTDGGIAPIERTPQFEQDNRENIAAMVGDGIFDHGRPADLYMFIPDLNVADRFDVLAAMLSARGHSDARIEKILGANFARVLGDVWG